MIGEKGAVAEKKEWRERKGDDLLLPTFLTFYFGVRAFSTSWTRLTRPEAWNRLNLPEQLFKLEDFLVSYEKGREFISNNLLFKVVTESSSCTLGGVVHTKEEKNAATFTKWSLTRGEKQWKTIRPSGQKVVEVAYRR